MTILVLFGGVSPEHEVSLRSAAYVLECLAAHGTYELLPVGITKDGRWLHYPGDDWDAIAGDAWENHPGCRSAVLSPARGDGLLVDGDKRRVDVVFPALHGCNGEDGSVQGLCQLAGIPCVGADSTGSAVCMDKGVMRSLVERQGIRLAAWDSFFYDAFKADPDAVTARLAPLGYPLFIKPARAGSSVGISKVHAPGDLSAALARAAAIDGKIIAESAVKGREFEVAVIGNRDLVLSPVGEIILTGAEFYDYEAKYIDDTVARTACPADIPDDVSETIRGMAAQVYQAVGCEGLARVDFFLDEQGPVFNEINTLPGDTSISLFPKLMELAGYSGPALMARLVDLAVEGHALHVERDIRGLPHQVKGHG